MTNSYWEQRAKEERKWQREQLKKDGQFNRKLQTYYDQAVANINKEIDAELGSLAHRNHSTLAEAKKAVSQADVNEYAQEAQQLVHEAELERAKGHRVTFSDYSDEVNERMRIYNATMRINRLELLKSRIGLQMIRAGIKVDQGMQAKVADDYMTELKRQTGILGMSVDEGFWSSSKVAKQVMIQIGGATFSQRIWQNQDALKAKLDQVISVGIMRGQSPQAMARELKKQVKSTVQNHEYVTERIARTESARVQFNAQTESLTEAGFRYCLWFAEPTACAICKEIASDNPTGLRPGVYQLTKVPTIPAHPNCRCSISAYVDRTKRNNFVHNNHPEVKRLLDMNLQFPQLTDKEKWALASYISSESYKLNDALRNEILTNEQRMMVQYLDSALEQMPSYTDSKPLQRDYFFSDQESLNDFVEPLKIGGIFEDAAYLSTAKDGYSYNDNRTIRVIIKSSKSGKDISNFNLGEHEVLFPRNTRFVIEDAYVDKDGNMIMVWSEKDE